MVSSVVPDLFHCATDAASTLHARPPTQANHDLPTTSASSMPAPTSSTCLLQDQGYSSSSARPDLTLVLSNTAPGIPPAVPLDRNQRQHTMTHTLCAVCPALLLALPWHRSSSGQASTAPRPIHAAPLVSTQPPLQIWVSHDDDQIRRVGGRVLRLPDSVITDALA